MIKSKLGLDPQLLRPLNRSASDGKTHNFLFSDRVLRRQHFWLLRTSFTAHRCCINRFKKNFSYVVICPRIGLQQPVQLILAPAK